KKDLIIRGGANIYPREIEEVLYTYSKVAETAVIGVPSELFGEEVKAYIVVVPGESATEEEIRGYCSSKLAGYKVPKYVEVVNEIPKSKATDKILKRDLRKDLNSRQTKQR
ncbi:MAG: long-chain fatty acid--CoA ligase, partial [Candidatus Micrarchaeota archaeon]